MRTRRFLLTATALIACKKQQPKFEEIHANPKGSFYDAGQVDPPTDAAVQETQPLATDAATATDAAVPADAPMINRMPANPKGSRYDAGLEPTLLRKPQ